MAPPGPFPDRSLSPALRELLLGAALLVVPWALYPGSFASQAPAGPEVRAWTLAVGLVFATMAVGGLFAFQGARRLLRVWAGTGPGPTGPKRRALANALRDPRSRWVWGTSVALFALFFAFFTGLLGVDLKGGLDVPGGPYGAVVYCCGAWGITPGLVLVPNGVLELSADPQELLLLSVSTALFSANMVAAVALWKGSLRAGPATLAGTLGTLGALFVNCPQCGTLVLFSALEGTAAAGLLVGWVAFQAPLLVAAFPLSLLTLAYSARALARPPACPRPGLPPPGTGVGRPR
jgi:hypothetical protein